ncbi:hypothetical protein ABK040_002608 [Willaertia magna]
MCLNQLPEELLSNILEFLVQERNLKEWRSKQFGNLNMISLEFINTLFSLKHTDTILWNKIHFNSFFWKDIELNYHDFIDVYFGKEDSDIYILEFIEFSKVLCDASNLITKILVPYVVFNNESFVEHFYSLEMIRIVDFSFKKGDKCLTLKFPRLRQLDYPKTDSYDLSPVINSHCDQLEKVIERDCDFIEFEPLLLKCSNIKDIDLKYVRISSIDYQILNDKMFQLNITTLRLKCSLNILQCNNWKHLCYELKNLKYLNLLVSEKEISFIGLDKTKNKSIINNPVEIPLQLKQFIVCSVGNSTVHLHDSLEMPNLVRLGLVAVQYTTPSIILFPNLKDLNILNCLMPNIDINYWFHSGSIIEIFNFHSKENYRQPINIPKLKKPLKYLKINLDHQKNNKHVKIFIADCPLKVELSGVFYPVFIFGKKVNTIDILRYSRTTANHNILIQLEKCNEINISELFTGSFFTLYTKFKNVSSVNYLKLEDTIIEESRIHFYFSYAKLKDHSHLFPRFQKLNIKNLRVEYEDIHDCPHFYILALTGSELKNSVTNGNEILNYHDSWRKELTKEKYVIESKYLQNCTIDDVKEVEIKNCYKLESLNLIHVNCTICDNSLRNITDIYLYNSSFLSDKYNHLDLNTLPLLRNLTIKKSDKFTISLVEQHCCIREIALEEMKDANIKMFLNTPNLRKLVMKKVEFVDEFIVEVLFSPKLLNYNKI